MIVKTLRWKVPRFGRLIEYVGRESEHPDGFQLFHNLHAGDSLEGIAEQFRENDSYRRLRKNGVAIYHEVLSFHGQDREHLTPEILEDLTREYLRLRAPSGLGFAAPHYDREHVHVHVMISGNEFKSSETHRLDNRSFAKLRRDIEAYQVEHYPELEHSVVHLTKPVRSKDLKKEIESERETIDQCFQEAVGLQDFLDRLSDVGVDQKSLHGESRLELNIDMERLQEMDNRVAELEELTSGREQERDCQELGDDFERER